MHVEFFRDEQGQVAGFLLYVDHASGMRFERISKG